MTVEQYHQWFEDTFASEKARFDAMPVADVLAEAAAGRFGECHAIWKSIGARATPAANRQLLAFLDSDAEYLHRYHCAGALITINRLPFDPVELSGAPKYPVAENLARVRSTLGL